MDAFRPGSHLAALRDAAEAAARRVDWSDEAVVATGGVCTPGVDHCHESFRCKIPFEVTYDRMNVQYWLTDRGGVQGGTPFADLEPYQRKRALNALQALG